MIRRPTTAGAPKATPTIRHSRRSTAKSLKPAWTTDGGDTQACFSWSSLVAATLVANHRVETAALPHRDVATAGRPGPGGRDRGGRRTAIGIPTPSVPAGAPARGVFHGTDAVGRIANALGGT